MNFKKSPQLTLEERKPNRFLVTITEVRPLMLILIIFIISLFMSIFYPETFFTFNNLKTILYNSSFEIMIAIGMTILFITGGFDLSVGAVMILSGAIIARALEIWQWGIIPSVLLVLFIAGTIGLVNGTIVNKVGVNPLITTLATWIALRGVAIIVSGAGIFINNKSFINIGKNTFLSFPLPFWYMIIMVAIFSYLLAYNRFFRKYYFIGGSEYSAKLSGINIVKMRMIAYILCSIIAGFVGIIFAARMEMALITSGGGVELRVITAVVLGGASLEGGRGSILGTALGVIFMTLINNVIVIAHLSAFIFPIIIGFVLLGAVVMDALLRRRSVV
jgi:ribose transport system permease protein